MGSLQIGDYSAWICIEGVPCPIYQAEGDAASASCWITSEVGRRFSVNWYNTTRSIPVQAVVVIDGQICDTHVMLDAHRFPHKPYGIGVSYARTSDWTRRDFQFAPILTSDDESLLDTIESSTDIGTIMLKLYKISVEGVSSEILKHRRAAPSLEPRLVHERSKKAGAHLVTFGQEYSAPAPSVDMVRGTLMSPNPFIVFTFRYRPQSILLANDIIPRQLVDPCPSPPSWSRQPGPELDLKANTAIRRLEIRIKGLKALKGGLVATAGVQKSPTARTHATPPSRSKRKTSRKSKAVRSGRSRGAAAIQPDTENEAMNMSP